MGVDEVVGIEQVAHQPEAPDPRIDLDPSADLGDLERVAEPGGQVEDRHPVRVLGVTHRLGDAQPDCRACDFMHVALRLFEHCHVRHAAQREAMWVGQQVDRLAGPDAAKVHLLQPGAGPLANGLEILTTPRRVHRPQRFGEVRIDGSDWQRHDPRKFGGAPLHHLRWLADPAMSDVAVGA